MKAGMEQLASSAGRNLQNSIRWRQEEEAKSWTTCFDVVDRDNKLIVQVSSETKGVFSSPQIPNFGTT